MKTFTRLKHSFILFFCLGLSLSAVAQTIYVKHDAAGSNDGSSWANAYTDLSVAIDNANSGSEIWVAAGTYHPGSGSPVDTSSFFLKSGVAIYGGFMGTESMRGERDFLSNPTRLSGDINEDDILGEWYTNKSDNVLHVLFADGEVDNTAIVDGFIVSHGYTDTVNTTSFDHWRGAGLHTRGGPLIRNCTFSDHYSRFGSSIYAINTTGLQVIRCRFTNNFAESSNAGILGLYANGTVVDSCEFLTNVSNWGTGLYFANSNVEIYRSRFINNSATNAGAIYIDGTDSLGTMVMIEFCEFRENSASAFGGGAFYSWNENYRMSNCQFFDNRATNAGAIYNDGRLGGRSFSMDNCRFEGNTTTEWGGAIYNGRSTFDYKDCIIKDNTATLTAGGIYNGGEGGTASYNNCQFIGNQAEFGWGGGLINYSSDVDINDCLFEANICENGGGGMSCGFAANISVTNCTYTKNEAGYGGAVFSQNDFTTITIDSCVFTDNQAESTGGGLYGIESPDITLNNSFFQGNTADVGGAINMIDDTLDMANLEVNNIDFSLNIAQTQGGAINLSNTDCQINSCVFFSNLASGTGTGGAISNNVGDSVSTAVDVVNSSFVSNIGVLAAGIAQWTDNGGVANLNLQNSIFYNPDGLNYAIEAGTPTVTSKGANLCSDDSMEDDLTHSKDLINTDPLLVNFIDGDLKLTESSPCVNAGISAGAPLFDIEGKPRVDSVDIGAYESLFTITSTTEVIDNSVLQVFPNPVDRLAQLRLDNGWRGPLSVQLRDASGKLLRQEYLHKSANLLQYELDMSQLGTGMYLLSLTDGLQVVTRTVIKG
ncbi:MAG: T9SS type A sorting domain-containing protein [Bacteroidota bacterium]